MAYSPNTADIINLILQGSANVESIIRANSLDQMAVPAANLSINSKRLLSVGQGIVSTDGPDLGQLAGIQLPYVISGCLWTADSPGSSLNCSMTSGVVSIKGIQLTVAAVTSRAFTANDDTYVDFADNGDGTANITYTTVPNLTTSPALANSGTALTTLRNAIIAAGASSVASVGIVQATVSSASSPASFLSTTVAAGSNGQGIGTNPLNLAAVTNAPTGGGYVVWTSASNGEQALLSYTGVSGSTLTGTAVLAGRPGAAYATGDTVKGIWPVGVADMIGNAVFRSNPLGGVSGSGVVLNTITTTSTTTGTYLVGPGGNTYCFVAPFVVPPGGGRQVKVVFNCPLLKSSATAGTALTVNLAIDGHVLTSTNPQASVTSDGVFFIGYSSVLTPGLHYAAVEPFQGAAGTLTLGVTFLTSQVVVEFV